jgi:glucosamine 6-phosphate synthetase-like amidotransferase/phosphosugar isomerase protein
LLSLSGAAGFNLIKWEGEEGFLNQRITKLSLKKEFKTQFIDEYVEVLISDVYQELNSLGKGQNNNLSRKDLIKINLKIPINSKGEFDLFTQKEIVEKYRKIEQIKKNIATELNKLSSIKVDYE